MLRNKENHQVNELEKSKMQNFLKEVLLNMPPDWLNLTTHRLDVYDEQLAKTQFLESFNMLFKNNNTDTSALGKLPTAFDYIRLGHPLSCVLEWAIAHQNHLNPENVISFSSKTAPILAVLRKNSLDKKNTQIVYTGELPETFDLLTLKNIYRYQFEIRGIEKDEKIPSFDGSTIYVSFGDDLSDFRTSPAIDFSINVHSLLGSVILVLGETNQKYISEIQHFRRRETIAMTPDNSSIALRSLTDDYNIETSTTISKEDKSIVLRTIKEVSGSSTKALVGSSGLSIQYAIMMGLVHHSLEAHQGKPIKFIVPPNCYGGTNDQARRVAQSIENVDVVDLPVDGGNDMIESIELVLGRISKEDAVPYIIAEIPTNPRVEVPDLLKLKEVLSQKRKTLEGNTAVEPIFILDQTFCPNVHFLGDGEILSTVNTISYVSGSKFPSGGKCTAGYCVGNTSAEALMDKIEFHLRLFDNEATELQMSILAKQMPSMIQRIGDAYHNTRQFVDFIEEKLPAAKINFVSKELAAQDFTPSVFSLDLPTKGDTEEERETYKRQQNHKLINLMISRIPNESKHCVSYGQLKGCYWTIPATSTQGTTKEGDKDYIARVALSPEINLELHKKVFLEFIGEP